MDQQFFFLFFFTKLDNNKSNNNNDNNLKSNIFCLCSILLIHINRGFLSHHVLHIQMIGMYRSNHSEGAESVSSLVLIETCTFVERPSPRAGQPHGDSLCGPAHSGVHASSPAKSVRYAPKNRESGSAAASARPLPGCKTFNDTYSDLNIGLYFGKEKEKKVASCLIYIHT